MRMIMIRINIYKGFIAVDQQVSSLWKKSSLLLLRGNSYVDLSDQAYSVLYTCTETTNQTQL
jgi:hypothetical protein